MRAKFQTQDKQICKQTHQFKPEPGQRSVNLCSPQLFVGLVTPADAHWSASGARLLRRFLGLSRCSEGMDQSVLNVLQDHGGQSVLAVAVSVHAVRLNVASWKCHIDFWERFYCTLDIVLLSPDQNKYVCLSSAASVIPARC